MTSHYVDIAVIPDPESSASHVLGVLYDRLHLTLVTQRVQDIGVSFPGYCLCPRTLGATLRLHGADASLVRLLETPWLRGVRDHVHVGQIAPVPDGARYRTVYRRQFKTSVDRLRRRRARRKNETLEQAISAIPASVERRPDLPFAQLRSRSTGQQFSLFIAMGELMTNPIHGAFNTHGLSSTSTIPWF